MGVAFFISGSGNLIHVPDNHIGVVIQNPERFGLSSEEVRAAYKKHGERIGIEGEARKRTSIQDYQPRMDTNKKI